VISSVLESGFLSAAFSLHEKKKSAVKTLKRKFSNHLFLLLTYLYY